MLSSVLVVFVATLGSAGATEQAALEALRSGNHVALMRHADAPGGFGDPAGFKLDDCATQRNLSPQGRVDAITTGAWLRGKGITFAAILSSPWCRCLDTARLMGMGPAAVSSAFANVVVLREERERILAAGRAVIDDWHGPGSLLVVTHGANIGGIAGVNPNSGEIVVVLPRRGASPKVVGRLLAVTAK